MFIQEEGHPYLREIDDKTTLWRYMDLARLISLLEKEALYFARADQMSDKWEGAYGQANARLRPVVYGEMSSAIKSTMTKSALYMRQRIYFNCWHASEVESAAMWGLYQTDGKGVAVRTTWQRVKASLVGPRVVYGGPVAYVDYKKEYIPEDNLFGPYMRKRLSFSHEREVRLICLDDDAIVPDSPPGHAIAVDLDLLVDGLYVAPEAPGWFVDLISELTVRYGRNWSVEHSDLADGPVW